MVTGAIIYEIREYSIPRTHEVHYISTANWLATKLSRETPDVPVRVFVRGVDGVTYPIAEYLNGEQCTELSVHD